LPLSASPRRGAAVALAFALVLAASPSAAADPDAYKLHMENGVKLFADHNFSAAVVEFQAAYEARPGPNPLVNVALCDKEMFRYPQAIAALETALGKHGDAMDPADRRAAEDAIKEMRALLGTVTVSVSPPGATLLVDEDELPAGAAAQPIPLGPGTHKIAARAPGYAPAEQTVTVRSKLDQTVTLALVAEKGPVTIVAPDPRMTITVDGQPVGSGTWSGLLAPGRHEVRMFGPEGQPVAMEILVVAGVPLAVSKGAGGVPIPPAKQEEPPRRGVYLLGLGSVLFPAVHLQEFPNISRPDFGAGYGLRLGYQVNKVAGFEVSYEHSSITTYALSTADYKYRLISDRAMAGLRLVSPGKSLRFVGDVGGGLVYDELNVALPPCAPSPNCITGDHVGADAIVFVEAGLELDLDRVLLDFVGEGQIASTGNLSGISLSLYGKKPLVMGGPALRIGYRFW
jgi:hypothetical protein